MPNVALYLRVSTNDQTIENQRRELTAAAQRHGWTVVAEFTDEGISGSKGRDQRPGFEALMQGIARREFDMIAAWSVDRLSRSLTHLLEFLGEIRAKGVDLYLHTQGLDTSTPAGKALFQMMGVFAELERAIMVERVHAGLRRAVERGKTLGRPRINATKELHIVTALRDGRGIGSTARKYKVGTSVVQRIKAELAKAQPAA